MPKYFGIAKQNLTIEEKIDIAWKTANAFALVEVDQNARDKYLSLLIDPTTSETKKTKIIEVRNWLDYVWSKYNEVVEKIRNGENTSFSPKDITIPKPWTYKDISESE